MLSGLRRRIGALIGGFEAAQGSRRLKGFQPSRAHVNTLIAAAGSDITARARYLVRNNGYALNAAESWTGNAVGTGIKPSSLIADKDLKALVQQLWLAWTDESDAEGLTDFYGQQRRAAREVFIAGEVFFRLRPRRPEDGLTVPLQLQMLPSEMLPLTRTEILPGGNVIRQGIEFDRIGRRVAYHFLRRHPGDCTDPGLVGETVRVPATEIIHVIDPVESGQLRGVSRLAPAIVKLFLLDQYDDAELERKKIAAMYAMFVTSPAPADVIDLVPADDGSGDRIVEVQPGQVVPLEPGEQIQTSAPADVGGSYEPFEYRTLLQISAATGVPYAYLSNDMLKANYSNSRMALLEFRRRVEAWQHSVMVHQMCRVVWQRWMDVAVLSGALDIPGYERNRAAFIACSWLPPKWDWVDPLKDAKAEIEQIDAGLKSRTQALAERGFDAEQVDAEIAADRDREQRLGLSFGATPPAAPTHDTSPISRRMDMSERVFSIDTVSEVTGISRANLHQMICRRHFVPIHSTRNGVARDFTLRDMVHLAVVSDLRSIGVDLRRAVNMVGSSADGTAGRDIVTCRSGEIEITVDVARIADRVRDRMAGERS
ncbi:phage portal protein [Magnetospirillum sp. UT-4]|uniref:phage portal protein n=1 Tax=Magnetospirillum sp. UT-4 TaxID=2681467 RepID=UPI00137D35F7|nr:phage portal protein [Magnetospirillum sp. UT-4]CAA7615721.1 Bacteriophage capsid protein (modular protein) [Magnetospirillum sp. UT-4]